MLILAREFASNLATPMLIVDDEGMLIFFNEAAEEIFGQTFTETGEIPFEEWSTKFDPRTLDAEPLPQSVGPPGSRCTSGVRRTSAFGSRAWTASTARSR